MNIQEASAILFKHFLKNDSVNNEQFAQIAAKKSSFSEAEAAFSWALKVFEDRGIVSKFAGTNKDKAVIFTWVLNKPLALQEQLVSVDGTTAISISNAVNSFFQSTGNNNNYCNPLALTAADLGVLLEMISIYAQQNVQAVIKARNDETQN